MMNPANETAKGSETDKGKDKPNSNGESNNVDRDDAPTPQANTHCPVSDEFRGDVKDENSPTLFGGSTNSLNPFDPGSLRLNGSDDFTVKKELTIVPCRKPNSHAFVRVHPDGEFCVETAVFEDKLEREMYLVDRSLWADLAKDIKPVCLFTTVDRQGNVFLWPVKLPGQFKANQWNESALAAAQIAKSKWIRVESNMDAGMYDVNVAQGVIPEPNWPDKSLSELLQLCFQTRLIDSIDHPILKRLRGQL